MANKAPTIKLAADWTTAHFDSKNVCVGIISSGVTTSFCIKEINNAPVDLETCKSRIYAAKNQGSVNRPLSKGYSEQLIKVTVPFIDEEYLKKIEEKSKWELLKKEVGSGSTTYTFDTCLKTDSKEKQD